MNRTPKRTADGQICLFSVSYYPIVSKNAAACPTGLAFSAYHSKSSWRPRWIIKIYNHNSVLYFFIQHIFKIVHFYPPKKYFIKQAKTGSQNLTHYPSGTPDNLKLYSLFCQNQFLGFNIAHYCPQVLLKSFGLYIYHIEFNFLSSFLNLLLHGNSKTDPLCPTLNLIDDSCIAP